MASISISDLRVSYNKRKTFALKGLNLEIRDGEFCVFLGPSGCGKSTAMHCIAGLIHPDTGDVEIGGKAMTSVKNREFVPPQERNIAMVFQEYALYPNMTVGRNMAFALETRKTPREEINVKVNKMAQMLGIDHLLDRRPAELSGGQRQRVALGRALVRDPSVFLLDEPLGNLDAKLRDQVRYELKKIQTQMKVTTVYVTHDQTEAMTMADHIVLMKDGEIIQQGTPSQMYDHPCNLFVAGFLGSPQINTFACAVRKDSDGSLYFDTENFRLPVPETMLKTMEPMENREIVLGIRPSDFILAAQEEKNVIGAAVDSVELLGDAYLIYTRIGNQVTIVKVAEGNGDFGKALALKVDPTKMHVFDKESGLRING